MADDYVFVGPYLTMSIGGLTDTVRPAFEVLQKDLEAAGNTAAQAGAKEGAKYAKQNHRFKNRSGELEGSIGWRALVKHGTEPRSEFFATAEHALYIEAGTKPHPIDPKTGNPTGMMWWNDPWPDGILVHAVHVNHPGTWGSNGPPDHFMDRASVPALAETERVLEAGVDAACVRADRALR